MTLKKLLKDMKPLLVSAGIPARQINIRNSEAKIDTLLKAFDWLHDIKMSEEYEKMGYVWNLVAPVTWDRYEKLNITGLREQTMLEEAQKALLKLWKTNRPKIFGTRKNKND